MTCSDSGRSLLSSPELIYKLTIVISNKFKEYYKLESYFTWIEFECELEFLFEPVACSIQSESKCLDWNETNKNE